VPEIVPEIVTIVGAPLVGYLVGGLKSLLGEGAQDRLAVLLTIFTGMVVAALVYGAGLVDVDGFTGVQIGARIVLSGLGLALAASGARSWAQASKE
jgi:hypothetical protein